MARLALWAGSLALCLQLISQVGRPARAQCQLTYLTTPVSNYFIQFSIHLMSYVEHAADNTSHGVDSDGDALTNVADTGRGRFVLRQLDHNATSERLAAAGVNASLPFLFFTNGFYSVDEYGNVSNTWMFQVARTFAARKLRDYGAEGLAHAPDRVNLVFITWSLPYYWQVSSVVSMIPAYFKTVAYYDRISRFVSGTITSMVSYVEQHADWQQTLEGRARRFAFYRQFGFYGHSLGSHIMVDAIMRVHERTGLKFGRLSALDPANPCFLNLEHGLSVKWLAAAVSQLYVFHSNAGLAGLGTERADVEVVLNGGTFQPGCFWLDFSCSHGRATDIFGYLDDQCQMVAYKCSNYQHFKIGACETCDSGAAGGLHANDSEYTIHQRQSPGCVAINLPEQYRGDVSGGGGETGDGLDEPADAEQPIRQLAEDNVVADHNRAAAGRAESTTARSSYATAPQLRRRESNDKPQTKYSHYVNTNANFASGRKTHCLQHYQARLLINYRGDGGARRPSCPISAFYQSRREKIRISLFTKQQLARDGDRGGGGAGGELVMPPGDRSSESGRARRARGWTNIDRRAGSFKLDKAATRSRVEDVIRDSLYTTLVTFEGPPRLYVGSLLENVDLAGLSKCLAAHETTTTTASNQSSSGLDFVMDVAFMSNTNHKIRRAFSSILCGHWSAQSEPADGLVLTLCRPSELANVSSEIDQLLDQVREENFYETWTISLLNSLFSLFTEWRPLK